MRSDSIDLVIFDCDGVLIDSEVVSARVIVEMLAMEGVLIDLEYVYKHFLGRQFSCVGRTVLENFAIRLPESFEADYRHALLSAFEEELKITTGLKDVLSSLNVPNCVATSSSRQRTQGALELVGLTDHFGNRIFTASDVKHGKPAPDLFLFTSEVMQVQPKNCLVIEDSLMGIEAALVAGMRVWRYTGASHLSSTTGELKGQFSQVPVFDDWAAIFAMEPALQKLNTLLENQNDNQISG